MRFCEFIVLHQLEWGCKILLIATSPPPPPLLSILDTMNPRIPTIPLVVHYTVLPLLPGKFSSRVLTIPPVVPCNPFLLYLTTLAPEKPSASDGHKSSSNHLHNDFASKYKRMYQHIRRYICAKDKYSAWLKL